VIAEKPGSKTACAPATTREQLVAYLTYAVDEVAFYSETSALLLRMAISDLQGEKGPAPSGKPVHKLS
jgi:hypothetical protein